MAIKNALMIMYVAEKKKRYNVKTQNWLFIFIYIFLGSPLQSQLTLDFIFPSIQQEFAKSI